jgi:PAS domain S-box-containing protein
MNGRTAQVAAPATDDAARWTGIAAVGHLPWGTHFCHFYQDRADLLDIIVPYFRAGLEGDEFCLWVTCDDVEKAREELGQALPGLDLHLNTGDLEIVSCSQWYLRDGRFNADGAIEGWREKLEAALARGHTGMRVHANESWLSRKTWEAFTAYEQRLDAGIRERRMIVLCTYPLEGSTGSEIFDVARTHQFAIARRQGVWEMMETVELVAAKAEIQRLNAALEQRVETRTRQLAEANAALRDSEELYRVLAENTTDLIILYEVDGRAVYVSPAALRVLGEAPEDAFAGVHPDDLAAVQEAWQRILAGERTFVTYRRAAADGSWRWLESSSSLVQYRGRPHVLAACRDVTERMRLEEQLRQAQKMEAVGRLAGGVAHDFNNLLTAILGYSELALDELDADSPLAGDIGEIRLAANRARGVTRQLLAFSRRQVLQPRVVDVGGVVRGMERMLRLLLREDVRFEVGTGEHPLLVNADPVQIEQVLMNLIVNARDATEPGGSITIETGLFDAAKHADRLPAYVRPGQYGRIVVADTGVGMTEEVAAQVFEPFFTTKPTGFGTGLGLSTVFGIVKQSGGYVWVESEPGHGATVTVLLPVTKDPEQAPTEVCVLTRHHLEGVAVVVVEDDKAVRHFAVDVLRRRGVDVLDFATPDEALAVLGDPHRPVDVLITDVILPGMSGPQMVERIRPGRPDLGVIYMSGYTAEEAALTQLLRHAAVLEKPFGPGDLLDRVAAAVPPSFTKEDAR